MHAEVAGLVLFGQDDVLIEGGEALQRGGDPEHRGQLVAVLHRPFGRDFGDGAREGVARVEQVLRLLHAEEGHDGPATRRLSGDRHAFRVAAGRGDVLPDPREAGEPVADAAV